MVNWNDMSQLQRRISETSVGVQRREAVLKELSPELGQFILEIGCGGGQLLKEVGLRVGPQWQSDWPGHQCRSNCGCQKLL